jgi:flagellin-like hook-associated protein FlgL
MTGLFGSVAFLAKNMEHLSMRSQSSINKILSAGDAVKRARQDRGAGEVSFAANLSFDSATKRNSINSFQNAISYMQMQEASLRQAAEIYEKMSSLASLASDPTLNQSDRQLLSDQFESLRQESLALNKSTFNGVNLFDELAASTEYKIDFASGLTNETTPTSSGPPKVWEVTKDVLYNTGTMTIDVNSGTAGDRYMLKQGNLTIFDSGSWVTRGSATTYDYDRFEVEYGPDKETTFKFVPLSDGNSTPIDLDGADGIKGTPDDGVLPSDSTFHNKSFVHSNTTKGYLTNLALSDDLTASGMDTRKDIEYVNQGIVSSANSDPDTTELTLRVESTSLFQIGAEFKLPEAEDFKVGNPDDLQVTMNPLGLGLMLDQDSGFPVISIATMADAAKAVESISTEIAGIGEQLGKLGGNFAKIEFSMEAIQKQIAIQDRTLSRISDDGFAEELAQLSKTRIIRSQSASLMTQAMSINEDIVNMLI